MQIAQVATAEEILVENAREHAAEGRLLTARIEACQPSGDSKNSRNGFHGFRMVMVYEEKA